jgi:transcriptional regulator with XRE-family HTH domain
MADPLVAPRTLCYMSVSTSAAARELGAELRLAREAAKLSQRALAKRAGFNNAVISLWESGKRVPNEGDLGTLADELGIEGDDRERILGKHRLAVERAGEVTAGGRADLDQLIGQERVARRITTVSPLLIPGLLQISGYARSIFEGDHPDVERLIAIRMGRADILRGREPVELHALIADDVLTAPIAPPKVMVDQLRHLLVMAALPHVTLQVIETHRGGYSPDRMGPFILIEFPSAAPIVHLEHHAAASTIFDPEDVRRFAAAATQVAEMAMTPARSAEVIAELVDGMESST